MEREGEVGEREMRKEGRGRRGGEKMRGLVIGGMILSLLLGCNNGEIEKLENKNKFLSSIVNLGNEFLNVFTSFGDMVGGVLGFNAETKKSEVGAYFNKVKETVEGTKEKLNKIVEDMQAENNPNAAAVKTKVEALIKDKLSNIIEGAKTASGAIGDPSDELLGNVAPHTSKAGGSKGDNVEKLVDGIKGIVNVVLGPNEGKHDAGTDKKATDGNADRTGGNTNNDEAGKLFNDTNAGGNANAKKSAADAAKAVGAVTGADILKAIIKDGSDAVKLADGTVGGSAAKRDAAIAGGIALRAMAKGGKFANASDDDSGIVAPLVKRTAISAVTKALDTLTIAIRKTIDEGLKEVKGAMKINANDNPVTSETGAVAK